MNMKKNIRLISLITCLFYVFMLFPSLFVFAASDNEAHKAGYSNGLWEGIDAAYSDLEDVKPKNYYKIMPKDADIIANYDLDKETASYRTSFIRGFKDGFREGYNTTYDNPKVEAKPTNYDEALGYEMGKLNGYSDYYAGKANKWANGVPNTTKLIEMFQLSKEPNAYKNSFITKFKEKYQEGYEFGYRYAKFEPIKNDISQGEKDGETLGGLLGYNNGKKDYFDNKTNQWDRKLPSDNDIKNTFSLNNDNIDYQNSFVSSFKKTYREKYNEAYRNANITYNTLLFNNGYAHGNAIGIKRGSDYAQIDYLQGKSNNIERYNYTNEKIIFEYNLFNENKRYTDGFIAGFKEGMSNGYILTYQEAAFDAFDSKLIAETIPIGGGQVASGDNKLHLEVDEGTFYNDVIVSIDKYLQVQNIVDMPSSDRYIKNSDLYLIRINNPAAKYDNDKNIKISFEYYGGYKGGIYRFHYGTWQYVPTKISENTITTYVSAKSIQESAIYGVFFDDKAINPLDIRGHWAKNDIITSLRRGFTEVYSDGSYRADLPITKAQLIHYLGKAYSVKLDSIDLDSIKGLKDNHVSYNELEKIMEKVTNNNGFKWEWIADKMIKNRDKRSNSFNSMENYVTRAEFSYMLNVLME